MTHQPAPAVKVACADAKQSDSNATETSGLMLSDLAPADEAIGVNMSEIKEINAANGNIAATNEVSISKNKIGSYRYSISISDMSGNVTQNNNNHTDPIISVSINQVHNKNRDNKIFVDVVQRYVDGISNVIKSGASSTKRVKLKPRPASSALPMTTNKSHIETETVKKDIMRTSPLTNDNESSIVPIEAKKRLSIRFDDLKEGSAKATVTVLSKSTVPSIPAVSAPPTTTGQSNATLPNAALPNAPHSLPGGVSTSKLPGAKELRLPPILFRGYAFRRDVSVPALLLITEGHSVDSFVDSLQSRLLYLCKKYKMPWFFFLDISIQELKHSNLPLYDWFQDNIKRGISWAEAKFRIVNSLGFLSNRIKAATNQSVYDCHQYSHEEFKSYFFRFCKVANAVLSLKIIDPDAADRTGTGLITIFIDNVDNANFKSFLRSRVLGFKEKTDETDAFSWNRFKDILKQEMENLMIEEAKFKKEKLLEDKKTGSPAKRKVEDRGMSSSSVSSNKEVTDFSNSSVSSSDEDFVQLPIAPRVSSRVVRITHRNPHESSRKVTLAIRGPRLSSYKKELGSPSPRKLKRVKLSTEDDTDLQEIIGRTKPLPQRNNGRNSYRMNQEMQEKTKQKYQQIASRRAQGMCTYCGVVKFSLGHIRVCEEKKRIIRLNGRTNVTLSR